MLLISCDWGTSTFRLRLLRGNGAVPGVAAERAGASGVTAFAPGADAGYRAFLAREISNLFESADIPPRPVSVILSGMITSTLGWKQPSYAELPFPLDGSSAVIERDHLDTEYGRHELVFVSGVKGIEEVMRGEECELIGLYARPESASFLQRSVAILPGTHSKVAEICDGKMIAFRTFLTGELFDILCRHSVLKHAVGAADPSAPAGSSFEAGIARVAERGLLGSLFSVRARSLLDRVASGPGRDFLSGLVIGDELRSVLDLYASDIPLLLCGSSALIELYRRGLTVLGHSGRLFVPYEATRLAAGLGHWRLSIHLIAADAWC